jgi:hypothetical protein
MSMRRLNELWSSPFPILSISSIIIYFWKYKCKSVILTGSKYLLYTQKHLKTLIMEEMKIIGNGEDLNSG